MRNRFSRIAVALVLTVTGFSIFVSSPVQKAYAGDDGAPKSHESESKLNEATMQRLIKSNPAPELQTSLERANIKRRLEYINDNNRLGYIYLLGDTGNVVAEYTIKGKASSLNSYLTPMEDVVCRYSDSCVTTEMSDLDGTYGKNVEGIFFFTTENAYVEWSGKYVYSSQALNINTPVSLTRTVQ